jgi:hypothetical protein
VTKTFTLLNGARGLDFPDGRSIQADSRGRVVVSDEQAAAIKGSAAMHRYDAILEIAPMRHTSHPEDRACECGFVPWPWQKSCSRCGSTIVDTQEE